MQSPAAHPPAEIDVLLDEVASHSEEAIATDDDKFMDVADCG